MRKLIVPSSAALRARLSWLAGLAALVLLSACAATENTPQACRFRQLAALPLDVIGTFPLLDLTIDGKPARFLLDTGASNSAVSQESAERLGLRRDAKRVVRMTTFSARTTNWGTEPVTLSFGTLTLEPGSLLLVVPLASMLPFHIDGLLGADLLSRFDVDIDMPRRRLVLYEPRRCPGGPPPFAPSATFHVQPNPARHVAIPVLLDRSLLQGLIDTGASRTAVDAQRAGLTPEALSGDREVRATTVDPFGASMRMHRFQRLQLGLNVFQRPVFAVGPVRQTGFDALLGSDIWRIRRLWISFAGSAVTVAQ